MTKITAELIKQLRDQTGVSMAKCKKALVSSNGNLEEAVTELRKEGQLSAEKKESRDAKEGKVAFAKNDSSIAFVEVNAETDFVVKNESFQEFADKVSNLILNQNPSSLEDLSSMKIGNETVEEMRSSLIQKIGENIQIKRFEIINGINGCSVGIYSHMGGKIVSYVTISGSKDFDDLAKDIAMHVTAESPDYLSREDVPADIIERERDIAKEQVKGKPENIMEKIIEGKVGAFCDQVCLLNQKFIKDTSISILKLLEEKSKGIDNNLKIESFGRWVVGS